MFKTKKNTFCTLCTFYYNKKLEHIANSHNCLNYTNIDFVNNNRNYYIKKY